MTAPRTARLGALQIGSAVEGTAATVEKLIAHRAQLADERLDLLVLPEALLGGYPKGADFSARVGYRLPEGRDAYLAYWQQAVDLDGPEVAAVLELASSLSTAIVVGVVERSGGSLYCTAVFVSDTGILTGRHRKLMPTAAERLIWAQGDAIEATTMQTRAGNVGAAICWENYMPRYRAALYDRGIDVWCAPTVDEREIWGVSMRHIAYEARAFVVSACQWQPPTTQALDNAITLRDRNKDVPMIVGGSLIVSPFGDIVAGPAMDGEMLVTAEVDLNDIIRARFDLDLAGHYARAELFRRQQP